MKTKTLDELHKDSLKLKNQSQDGSNNLQRIRESRSRPDTQTKTNEEILKVYNECIGKLSVNDVDTSSLEEFKNVIIPMMEQAYKKAITLTREDCEKEKQSMEKVILSYQNKDGQLRNFLIKTIQKAERERILEKIRKIAKDEIKSLKHEKSHPVNKALGEDVYNTEMYIAEWEDFLNTFENIQDKLKEELKKEVLKE